MPRRTTSIEVREASQKITRVIESLAAVDRRGVPQWLELDKDTFTGTLTALPSREDLTHADPRAAHRRALLDAE